MKRYACTTDGMVEAPKGQWVKREDVEEAMIALRRLIGHSHVIDSYVSVDPSDDPEDVAAIHRWHVAIELAENAI